MAVTTKLTKTQILKTLEEHAGIIKEYGVLKLGLFGSTVRNEVSGESDLDFLVEFQKGKKNYDNFIQLAFLLEDLFQKKVDLVTNKSISERLKKHIEKEIEYVSFDS